MNDLQYTTYAGVYQAYAYQQGELNRPVEFRCPDEYFSVYSGPDDWAGIEQGFDLVDFFTVVADIDAEGCCHYWKIRTVDEQIYLTLACTEDDSMLELPDEAEYLWAGGWLKLC